MLLKILFKILRRVEIFQRQNRTKYVKFLNPGFTISDRTVFGKYFNLLVIGNQCKLTISENVIFRNNCSVTLVNDGDLTIGQNVFFNNNCSVNCMENIRIGDNTIFGEAVKLYDHNHQIEKENIRLKIHGDKFTTQSINIGDNCWIGSDVVILKGVNIGNNAVIGAGSLIYKSVEPNSIIKAKVETITISYSK